MRIDDFLSALYSSLIGSDELMSAIMAVYYEPPGEAEGPYIVIGNARDIPGRIINARERQLTQTVYVWSCGTRKDLIGIRYMVEDAVNAIAGYEIYLDEVQILSADDDGWRQMVMDFRVYIQ